ALENELIFGANSQEQQREIREAAIIKGYIDGRLSTDKVAEMLNTSHEAAVGWLRNKIFATMQELLPELNEDDD
ncbi:MAG: UPF0175 family protein, partial [Deltaproteobacteria bacterium]|nr:UPF0175 family protein [Deltaproteobacteria bacterium]